MITGTLSPWSTDTWKPLWKRVLHYLCWLGSLHSSRAASDFDNIPTAQQCGQGSDPPMTWEKHKRARHHHFNICHLSQTNLSASLRLNSKPVNQCWRFFAHTWHWGRLHAAAASSSSACSSQSRCQPLNGLQPPLSCPPGRGSRLAEEAAAQIWETIRQQSSSIMSYSISQKGVLSYDLLQDERWTQIIWWCW